MYREPKQLGVGCENLNGIGANRDCERCFCSKKGWTQGCHGSGKAEDHVVSRQVFSYKFKMEWIRKVDYQKNSEENGFTDN